MTNRINTLSKLKIHMKILKKQLKGKWSVDIMPTKGKPYIIDMATMETSALRDKMINHW